jgi:hypothetical protein
MLLYWLPCGDSEVLVNCFTPPAMTSYLAVAIISTSSALLPFLSGF